MVSPIGKLLLEFAEHSFVTTMPAPVASGWNIAGRAFHPLECAAFARLTPKHEPAPREGRVGHRSAVNMGLWRGEVAL